MISSDVLGKDSPQQWSVCAQTPCEASPGPHRALEQSWGRPQHPQVETILCAFPNKIMILLTSQGIGAISH